MINNLNSTPSFGSTYIPVKNVPLGKYTKKLNKFFELKGFTDIHPQKASNAIDFGQAAIVMYPKNNLMVVVGKDGGPDGADRFIFEILKKIEPNAKYVDDIKPIEVEGPVIDLNI